MGRLPEMRFSPLLLTAAAFVMVGADDPAPISVLGPDTDPTPEKYDQFAQAVVACAEATKSPDISTAAIEMRGWTEYEQDDPKMSEVVATFSRPDTRVFMDVMMPEQICNALWYLSSEDGADAVWTAVHQAVSEQLSATYGQELPQAGSGQLVQQFAVGDSVGVLSLRPDPGYWIQLQMINRGNLDALRVRKQQPSQTQGQ